MSGSDLMVVVLGPTASGKSALGVHLAEALGGEILVCDSTQVYRHFDIGTAKVPPSARRGIQHHLIDLAEPREIFTAGDYRRHALEALADLRHRGKLPILTAGTGLYLRALLEGLSDAPTRSEPLRERLRRKARERGPDYLHRLLARADRKAAAKIAPRDTPKIIRAIEMRMLAGKTVAEIHEHGRAGLSGYRIIKIGLAPARAALYARINARTEAMMASGWVDEVRRMVAAGVPAGAKPFQFIGYRQLREHIEGRLPLSEAISSIQPATRRFAKRQMTWFRGERDVHWLPGFGDDPEIAAAALQLFPACR